jgi:hypothetical protein
MCLLVDNYRNFLWCGIRGQQFQLGFTAGHFTLSAENRSIPDFPCCSESFRRSSGKPDGRRFPEWETDVFQDLSPDRSRKEFTCKVTAGTHTAVFQIDPQQSSSDSNRRDNHLERSFTVEGYQVAKMKKTVQVADLPPQPRCTRVALPDISIDETVFEEPADYYTGNRFVRPGKKIRLRVDLRNLGQCETGVFYIRCLLTIQAHNQTGGIGKTEKSFQKKFGSIPPGQMSSTVFEYNALPDSWSYYSFDIRVDPDDRVEEFSEVMYKETHNFPQYLDGKTVLKEVIREIEAKEK